MIDLLIESVVYVLILIVNAALLYSVTRPAEVAKNEDQNNDNNKPGNDDDDGIFFTEPDLDLPPGVCLPTEPKELVTH
ncbi:MAG: hypothetical protein AAFQ94_02710 [Bacteroidota bacterium]